MKITKIFAKIIREAPGFFGGPSSLDHEGVILMKICCKSGSGSQPHGKVPGRKKPERAQVHKKKQNVFQKTRFAIAKLAKNACFACVARVARVACVQCVRWVRCVRYAFSGLQLFSPSSMFLSRVCKSSFKW